MFGIIGVLILTLINTKSVVTENDYFPGEKMSLI